MSRFWAGASSSSDSADDSDDSSSQASGASEDNNNVLGQNRWQFSDDSSDEDEGNRVVKSGKERFQETFATTIQSIRKSMKTQDYNEIQSEFDALSKLLTKNKQYLEAGVPRSLVKLLVNLQDFIEHKILDKVNFKQLSAKQGRALNRLKLTLRKHNKAYTAVMEAYRKSPDNDDNEFDDDDDEDAEDDGDNKDSSDSDSSSGSGSSSSSSSSSSSGNKKKTGKKGDSDDDDSSGDDSDDWGSDSSSSSSSEDEAGPQLKGRARWLKKVPVAKVKSKDDAKLKDIRNKTRAASRAAATAESLNAVTAIKSVLPKEGLTISMIQRRVTELAVTRRAKDIPGQLRELEALVRLASEFGPRTVTPILMYVISAQFALQRTMDDYMDTSTWWSCAMYLEKIAGYLDDGYTLGQEQVDASDIVLAKMTKTDEAKDRAPEFKHPVTGEPETTDERAERLRIEKENTMSETELKVIPVVGSLSLHLKRLEEEYVKSLQKISHHSNEYISRLRDERKLVLLLERYQVYFESIADYDAAATMALLRVEHIYYRHDDIAKHVDRAASFYERYGEVGLLHPACLGDAAEDESSLVHPAAMEGKPSLESGGDETADTFQSTVGGLCKFVYKYGADKAKTRAIICQIFHHALHDRFTEARDLLLMSHLQDTIYDSDVGTMILFNRMMVTLGMCAFRLGKIYDAHQCLYDICSGRVRELLAQGVNTSRFSEKSAEQEKAEKRRLVPYHQHINLDLLEACHLISAMLLEVPNMAGNFVDGDGGQRRQRVISRTFRKFHDQHNHQVFTGPPEDTRSYIMQASKALMKGDWNLSLHLLTQMEIWDLVPGENAASKIAQMLSSKIKLEGLRTYLFAFSAQYDSLSLSQLCGMFEMTKNEVHCVVSKMMINRELYASWDQPTETIVLRKIEPSALQVLALQFADKAAALVEANERLLDSQSGSYGYKDDHHGGYWKSGGEGGDRWQNRRGGNTGGGGGGGGYRGNNSGGPSDNNRYGGRRPGGRAGGRSSGGRTGRGNSSGGRGNSSGGRGNSSGGRGNSSGGRGNTSGGRGNSSGGRGTSSGGRGRGGGRNNRGPIFY